jgi:hypothetical protein
MRTPKSSLVALVLASAATATCTTILNLEAPVGSPDAGSGTGGSAPDAGHGSGGSTPDAGTSDAGDGGPISDAGDGGPISDAGDGGATPDGGDGGGTPDGGGTTWSALNDPSAWEFFSTGNVPTGDAGADLSFAGAAFDGRFVYFAPTASVVLRYDTQSSSPFTAPAAWSAFDTRNLTGLTSETFAGATFDGRYMWFVPNHMVIPGGTSDEPSGVVVRYDTQSASGFTSSASWSTFDTTTLQTGAGHPANGFSGATFDGTRMYFVPNLGAQGYPPDAGGEIRSGIVARFDPSVDAGAGEVNDAGVASIGAPAQWSTFDVASTNAAAGGFTRGVFDGTYVYLVPYRDLASNVYDGTVARLDTTASFESANSWSTIDLAQDVVSKAVGFGGGAFDGRSIYLAPADGSYTVAAQYDTTLAFGVGNSWATYDLSPLFAGAPDAGAGLAPRFTGLTFDGRYIYFPPAISGTAQVHVDPFLVRYDTQAPFVAPSAWSALDMKTFSASAASGYTGAVFDGQYVYLAPTDGQAARFKAKTPAAPVNLPGYFGSF